MHFENPEYFWLLILIPIFFGIKYWYRKKTCLPAILVSVFEDLQKISKKSWKRFLLPLKNFLVIFALIFLIIALARPQAVSEKEKINKNGLDIILAIDVSESMLAEDLQPNRIEAAKSYISDFIKKLTSDRVGLLVFAGKPFTQSALTFDYGIIDYYLKEISTKTVNQRMPGFSGTAIGDAILSATNRLKNNKNRTKVLILLTDGDANVGVDPLFASENARTSDVKIYTIGVGDKNGAPIPIGEQNGQKIYSQNPDGSLQKTHLDEKTLQQIAQITGGEYFYAGDNVALKNIFEQIQNLEKTDYEGDIVVSYQEKYWLFLFIGFVLTMFYALLKFFAPILK